MDLNMKNSLQIQYLPSAAVVPSPHATREHGVGQRRKLKNLLQKFGQVAPIIIDANNEIVDGHAVFETLRDLGHDEIAVVVVDNRTDAEIRALRLALNRIAEDATWSGKKLKEELQGLVSLGFDLDLTGFDSVEIDMALSIDEPGQEAADDLALANLPQCGATVTKPGDVWRLDRHIVGCGDARDQQHFGYLMPDVRAAVVFADPPYNVRVRGHVSGLGQHEHREFPMASGEMTRPEFVTFLSDFLAVMKAQVVDGAILFICMDWRHAGELLEAAERQHLELKNLCVWVKTNAGMGSFYRSRHELVFVFKHGQAPHQNHFQLGQHGRTRTNIWEYAGVNSFGKERDGLLAAHPTPKPVAMIADALRDVSKRGEYVVDPFLGSGSTLMAAEATGRICVGNELDAAYVDVAIRRWQKATGKAAIHVQTGQSFDATAQAIAESTLIEALVSNNTMTPPMATGVAGVAKGEPPETAALTVTDSITHLADTLAGSSSDLPLVDAAAPDDLDVVEEAGDDIEVRHD
jgi:DNA modification methylase